MQVQPAVVLMLDPADAASRICLRRPAGWLKLHSVGCQIMKIRELIAVKGTFSPGKVQLATGLL